MSRTGTLNHVRFTVSDVERAEPFWGAVLGFMGYRLVEKSPTRLAWAAMMADGHLAWVILSRASEGSMRKAHDRYAPGLHHFAWNADSRDDVDRFHEMLKGIGATVLDAPAEYDYEEGYYAVFFLDPDGMKLEVVHVPRAGCQRYWQEALGRGGPLET